MYHPNFCARQLGCPQLIPLKSYMRCNRASSWRDLDDLEEHKDASLPTSSTALAVLFAGWAVRTRGETHKFMVQTIKDINAQVLEDNSLTQNVGGQSAQAGQVFVTSVITAGDLKLPSGEEEEEEDQAEQTPVESTPSVRRKRKETAQLVTSAEGPSPPPSKSKRLRKRTVVEYVATEGTTAAPNATSDTDEELREAFEAVEQENELEELEEVGEGPQEKAKTMEEEEEIPAEVIAESIALAQKQQEDTRAGLTSSELALFEDPKAEHSTAAVVVPEAGAEVDASAPEVISFQVEVPRFVGALSVVTSPLKPPIIVMPIHSLPSSSATASFADPELAEFEAMDLDAQLDKLEMLSSPVGKAKSKAVMKAMERLKIWQSNELELDEDREAIDQLMKDLDLLHRQNMAPKPILEMSLRLARDVPNLHDRYEDLKPSFRTSEFYKATHEANLADFAKQKAELDQMVAGDKEAKSTVDKLEKQIEELQNFQASPGDCRGFNSSGGAASKGTLH
ncbi:unnamed protein product [Prunus armeniaca]